MCIIVAKPTGIRLPNIDILKDCYSNNPHGAGIMYSVGGNVNITKGYMTFNGFIDALNSIQEKHNTTEIPMVLHFRIATHGAVNKANCHPFPVTDDYDRMTQLTHTCKLAVAHNGVIRSSEKLSDIHNLNVSDTMAFIKHLIAPVASAHGGVHGFLTELEIPEMVTSASGGKMAFLDSKGRLSINGTFIESNGVYYSNNTFRRPKWDDYSIPYTYGKGSKGGAKKKAKASATANENYVPLKYRYYEEDFGY